MRPHQRILICPYGMAMRINEVLKLTWDRVDLKAGFIRLRAEDVKERNKRNTPIVPELQAVLMELKAEQGKVTSINQLVFTKAGKQISYGAFDQAFVKAAKRGKIQDVRPHDFRHTCITLWSMAGIPPRAVMAASGHSSLAMHNSYVNPKDSHLCRPSICLQGFNMKNRQRALIA
jgi:integrase